MDGLMLRNIYLFILMVVLALLEVQIEGKHGWAENLPTWKPKTNSQISKVFKTFMSGKDATGYHLSVFIFVILILHLPFFFTFTWRWWRELEVIALFFLFVVFWDFLWFILNPHYGLKKFKEVEIWWHNQWLGPWPIDYYWGIIFSFLIYTPVMFVDRSVLAQWFATFVTFIILTSIVVTIIEIKKYLKRY